MVLVAAGDNPFLDLEAAESMTQDPPTAVQTLIEAVPEVFRADWGVHMVRTGDGDAIVHGTVSTPTEVPNGVVRPENLEKAQGIEVAEWTELVVAASPLNARRARGRRQSRRPRVSGLRDRPPGPLVAMAASLRRNA